VALDPPTVYPSAHGNCGRATVEPGGMLIKATGLESLISPLSPASLWSDASAGLRAGIAAAVAAQGILAGPGIAWAAETRAPVGGARRQTQEANRPEHRPGVVLDHHPPIDRPRFLAGCSAIRRRFRRRAPRKSATRAGTTSSARRPSGWWRRSWGSWSWVA